VKTLAILRKLRVQKDGKEHCYWSQVETVRTADGPRQRTLCYLGELNSSAHARWQKTVEVFNEQGESTQLKLFPSAVEAPADPNVARVLVKKVRLERTRRFGDCYLALELWKRLGLEEFFAQHLDVDTADVAWSRVRWCSDCYRVERTSSRVGFLPLWTKHLSRRTTNMGLILQLCRTLRENIDYTELRRRGREARRALR
jgi:hypothetical protein